MLGESVEGKEEMLARILAEGHEIGNHTYTHPHALNLDDGELDHDIGRCQRVLAAAEPVLMRPPYGEDPVRVAPHRRSPRAADHRALVDRPQGLSRARPRGHRAGDGTEAAPGAIIDLHDGWPRVTSTERDRTPTIEGLRLALPRLAQNGLSDGHRVAAAGGLTRKLREPSARVVVSVRRARQNTYPARSKALDLVSRVGISHEMLKGAL